MTKQLVDLVGVDFKSGGKSVDQRQQTLSVRLSGGPVS